MTVAVFKGLTAGQATFVEHVASGADPIKAAELAGYSQPAAAVHSLMMSPNVQRAIHTLLSRNVLGKYVPLAWQVLYSLLVEKDIPPRVKLDAAKATLDRGGFPAQRPAEPDAPEVELAAMPMEELRRILEETEAAIAAKAKPVSVQASDMFD